MLVTLKPIRGGGATAGGKKWEKVLGLLLLYKYMDIVNCKMEIFSNRWSYWFALPGRDGAGGTAGLAKGTVGTLGTAVSPTPRCPSSAWQPPVQLFPGKEQVGTVRCSAFSCGKCLKNI